MIALLALAWAVVLLPAAFRPRFESSPLSSVGEFERSMGILASTRHGRQQVPGRWVMVPKGLRPEAAPRSRRQRVVERRRRTFVRLLIAATGTLVLGLFPSLRVLLLAHLGIDLALAVYVLQLRRWHLAEVQRARVVRPLPQQDEPEAPTEPDIATHSG